MQIGLIMPHRYNASTIKAKIEDLLQGVDSDKTICPSEVARALSSTDWREMMPLVRSCADELKTMGSIEILQRGKIIPSAHQAKGPIRLRMKTK
jgi:hypothetical protein